MVCVAAQVSIHAPAWGATTDWVQLVFAAAVSIHAPAWGATPFFWRLCKINASFNPRARVGRDTLHLCIDGWRYCVSIHAPAWGATG